jgi:hypothetical protein
MALSAVLMTSMSTAVAATPATPSLTTQASASVPVGGSIYDAAGLSGGRKYGASGQAITFTLFGPKDASCTGSPIFTSTEPVSTVGGATSASYVTKAIGTYHWTASFNGDANNKAVSEACGAEGESTTVTAAPPVLTPTEASLSASVCKAYSQTFSAGTGYTYAISTTPSGFNFQNGVLKGTPTVVGTYSFTIKATGSGLTTLTHAYTLTVSGLCIDAGHPLLPNGTEGTAYSTALSASGGTPNYRYQIAGGGLPSGLSMTTAGIISGTPTTTGTYSVTIEALDSSNPVHTGTATLTITIS